MASEVGSAYFTLLPSVKGLQGSIAKEVSGIDGAAAGNSIGKKMGGGIAGSIKSIVGPALLTLGAAKAFGFAKDAVASFSELEDSSAAASVVFGKNMGQIIEQSKTAGKNMGLSEQQVIAAANTFGTYGKAAGLSGKELANFATEQTALAADMASFKGTSPEQAIEAIGAALRGETEPIRAYGVMLDDASLRQEALRQGLITTTKDALSPQNKTLAAQALILKQTKDAQGDFARTSDSTANVQKTLAAESENLSAKIGGVLAPAFTAVRRKMLEGVRGTSSFVDTVAGATPRIGMAWSGIVDIFKNGNFSGKGGLGEALGISEDDPIVGFLFTVRETAIAAFGGFKDTIAPLAPLVLQLFSAISPLGLIFKSLAPVLPALAGAFGSFASAMGGALVTALSVALPVLTRVSGILVDSLGQIFMAVAPALVQVLGLMGTYFQQMAPVVGTLVGVVATLVGQLVSALAPILVDLATSVMPMVVSIFGAVLSAIVPVIQMIAGFLVPVVQALLPVVVFVFQAVANVIKSVMQIIQGVIQVVTGIISGNWSQVWTGILNIISGVWNTIVGVIRGALGLVGSIVIAGVGLAANFIRSAFSGVASFLGGIWGNIVNGVSGMIGRVTGFFSGLIGKITGAIGDAGGALLQTGKDIIQGLIDGIGSMMGAIGRAVISIVPQAIRGPFEKLLGIASPSKVFRRYGLNIGQGLVLGLKDMYSDIEGAVQGMVGIPDPAVNALAAAGSRYGYDVTQGEYRSGPLIEQNIHPREGQSEEAIGDSAARRILRRL